MENLYFEIQGLTWKGKADQQQDALLINGKVIQHKGLITQLHKYPLNQDWHIGIADGVSQSPHAKLAATTILDLCSADIQNSTALSLVSLQKQFCQALHNIPQSIGSSTTLAFLSHHQSQFLNLQYLGNTRAYLFSQPTQQWRCLTHDHTYLEELREKQLLQEGEQYASIYNALTQFFCADPIHNITEQPPFEEYLLENEAVVLCSDGVHDILECNQWSLLQPNQSLKEWLLQIKNKLAHSQAYDNVSIVIVRLSPVKFNTL
jgi:serine/threonine protein phosphatase PrpC